MQFWFSLTKEKLSGIFFHEFSLESLYDYRWSCKLIFFHDSSDTKSTIKVKRKFGEKLKNSFAVATRTA